METQIQDKLIDLIVSLTDTISKMADRLYKLEIEFIKLKGEKYEDK